MMINLNKTLKLIWLNEKANNILFRYYNKINNNIF